MMDLPVLVVDVGVGMTPMDWMHHNRNTVRIDGPLPTVECQQCDGEGAPLPRGTFPNQRNCRHCDGHGTRPLRVGDRVTLAEAPNPPHTYTVPPRPFATATVAKIEESNRLGVTVTRVTVSEVEALS